MQKVRPVDKWARWSETLRVSTGGLLRWRLANNLRSAYAAGLLTQDTFAHRIDHLYGSSVVEPDRLIGDLTFRRRAERPTVAEAVEQFIARWRGRDAQDDRQLPILALDWTGSTTQVLIGRGSSCDLVIQHRTVSRRHAQLFFREGSWILIDLRSTNGTFINGSRVRRSQLLPGDELAFGQEILRVD
jgi:FHA domain